MKKQLSFALVLCASFLWSSKAEAVYVFSEDWTNATYVHHILAYLCPGTHNFSTRNTSAGGDPVMHLLNGRDGNELAYSDDTVIFNGKVFVRSNEASITHTINGSCQFRTVIVRAYDNNSGGAGGKTSSLYFNGSLAGTFSLGGFQIVSVQG